MILGMDTVLELLAAVAAAGGPSPPPQLWLEPGPELLELVVLPGAARAGDAAKDRGDAASVLLDQ